jgi:cytochrome c-type biogenesis protein CcmH/NrfG
MFKEAIESFRQAIQMRPHDARTYYWLGITYGRSDNHKDAIDAYKQAIRIKPDYTDAHYHLGVAYTRLNDRNAALREHSILKKLDEQAADKLFKFIYE